MKEYRYALFIGRFQPLHNSHVAVMEHGLKIADNLLIIIGSCSAARNVKNPFTFEERKKMILDSLGEGIDRDRIIIRPMKDFFYNENIWTTNVQKIVREVAKDEPRVVMIGSFKDAGSAWLNQFPNFEISTVGATGINATTIRNSYFSCVNAENVVKWANRQVELEQISERVADFLSIFAQTEDFKNLREEYDFIQSYKKSWEVAPYPVTFVTTDCVVVCSGHVLLVVRGFRPGKGLYACPGGFLNVDELILDGAIRELKEETGIKIPKIALKNAVVDQKVFDYPGRSLRGRTITHAFCIKLNVDANGEMPSIKSGSDASDVRWVEFSDVHENQDKFFEDHYSMVSYFLYRNN